MSIACALPFRLGWFTPATHELWGIQGRTYGFIPHELLPPLPFEGFDGSFSWLPARDRRGLEFEDRLGSTTGLPQFEDEARQQGLVLPESFKHFVSTPRLYGSVRSSTDCYLEFSPGLIADPAGAGGRMLRFLNDSQCCMLWYLYLGADGTHAVLASAWHDQDLDDDERVAAKRFFACAGSFEEFACRYWLENRIFFRRFEHQARDPLEDAYFQCAKASRELLPPQPDEF
jgi:hypothetical protein